MAASTDVSIVIPLTDAPGDAVEHLSTWTHKQTHPPDRFQVVIASDGDQPDVNRDVAALLRPHDRFEVFGGASMIAPPPSTAPAPETNSAGLDRNGTKQVSPEVNPESTDNRELAIAVRRIALQPS